MHPELEDLQSKYNSLVDQVDAGNITIEQAMATLPSYTAIDGEGWLWSIDPETGTFQRSHPNGTPEPANASLFVAAQIQGYGGPTPVQSPPPFTPSTRPDLMTPPAPGPFGATAPPAPFAAPPGPFGAPASGPFGPGPADSNAPFGATGPYAAPVAPARTSRFSIPKLSRGGAGGSPSRMPSARTRTIILVVVAVIILLLVVKGRPSTTTTTTTTGGLPTSSVATTLPTTTLAPLTRGTPAVSRMSAVLGALGSGNSGDVAAIVRSSGGVRHLDYYTALYYGLTHEGLLISSTQPVRIPRTNEARSDITIYRPASQTGASPTTQLIVAHGPVTWVVFRGAWRISTWPALNFAGH
jgi:hypothetical protein